MNVMPKKPTLQLDGVFSSWKGDFQHEGGAGRYLPFCIRAVSRHNPPAAIMELADEENRIGFGLKLDRQP